jgi:uncharacterized GH25 family protein
MGLGSLRATQCKGIWSLLSALLWSLCAGGALAHDFWIEPQTFRPAVGAKVPLRLLVGMDFKGDAALFNPEYFERYLYSGPGGEQPVAGSLGDDPAGTMTITGPGLYTVLYHSKRFDLKFDSYAKFEEYLRLEGLERHLILAQSRGGSWGTIQEVYTRCAKALVAAPRAETAMAADQNFGCPLELMAETNPYRQSDLKLRLLYRGKPIEGALVVAFNKADPLTKLRARSDRDGRVAFKLTRPGVWLVTSVHMIALPRYVRADWESFWASLTFELPQ